MTEPRLTLVTGLFDLGRREGKTRHRTPEDYLRHGEFVLRLDQDLILFADPGLAEELLARRRSYGLGARTIAVATTLEDMPYGGMVEEIRRARERNPVVNANPEKDTPLYVAMMWSKFTMLERALSLDPFSATHFAWIDLGIAHVAITRHCREDRIFSRTSERVRLLMLRSFGAADVADLGSYYAYIRGLVGGGFITASRDSWNRLVGLFDAEARGALAQGFGPSDEQILPVLCQRNPDLFEFHYGDYPSLLDNYRILRGSADNLLFQLRHCRSAGDFQRGCDIGAGILSSQRDGTFEADPETLSWLLDEYFVAAYYLEQPVQKTAREIALCYAELVRADPAFRRAFLREERHIRQNFSFLSDPVVF